MAARLTCPLNPAPLVELPDLLAEAALDVGLAAAPRAEVENPLAPVAAVEDAPAAAEDEAAPGTGPSLPCAAAMTVLLNWPVTLSSSKRAEKAIKSAVPFAACLVDSMRMKLRREPEGG